MGEVEDAVRDAGASAKLATRPEEMLLVACVYARSAAEPEATVPRAARMFYQERALDLVALALRQLPPTERPTFWRRVQSEKALAALRSNGRMQEMARKFAR